MPLLLLSVTHKSAATCLPPEHDIFLYVWGLCITLNFFDGNNEGYFTVAVHFLIVLFAWDLNQFHQKMSRDVNHKNLFC